MQFKHLTAILFVAGITAGLNAQASTDIRVTYAGSMGKVMDQALGPAFAGQQGGKYEDRVRVHTVWRDCWQVRK